jgi:hypothetical protein
MSGTDVMAGCRPTPAATDLAKKLKALSEQDTGTLRQEWRRLYRSHPPARITRDLLVLAIAWKLQARVHGGLTIAQRRKLANIARAIRENGDLSGSTTMRLKPGARLLREWRGETHTVLVLANGFEWNGRYHRSLSAIAKAITGTPWSGPRFFGLKKKPRPFRKEEASGAK